MRARSPREHEITKVISEDIVINLRYSGYEGYKTTEN
jgi:hypothetical protein